MVTIRFPNVATERKALAFLIGHFSGRVTRTGEHIVPEEALEALADQDIPFTVEGKATYEQQLAAVRSAASTSVQRRARSSGRWIADAVMELVAQFGGASYETQ